jgi:hypothetical protein
MEDIASSCTPRAYSLQYELQATIELMVLMVFHNIIAPPYPSVMDRALYAEEYKRYISAPSSGKKISYGHAESLMMIHKVMLGLIRVVVQQPCFDKDSYCHATLVEQLTRSPESDHFSILANVIDRCTGLREFHAGGTALTDASIRALALNCAGLELLDICGCAGANDASIIAIAEKGPA